MALNRLFPGHCAPPHGPVVDAAVVQPRRHRVGPRDVDDLVRRQDGAARARRGPGHVDDLGRAVLVGVMLEARLHHRVVRSERGRPSVQDGILPLCVGN